MDYVLAYNSWRRKLPHEIISKVPEVICIYRDRSSKPIRYYLFTSFVPYRDDEQLNPQGVYKHLWYPTEKDEEHFRALRKLIQSHRSTFNAEKLEFGCIKQGMYVSKKDWKGILLSNATPAE